MSDNSEIPPETPADAATANPAPPAIDSPQPTPPGSTEHAPAGKADLGNRAVALLIDGLCAFVIGWVPGVGGLVGAAYMLLRDGLELDFMNHRSIGKSVMRLHVESVDGAPTDVGTSIRRNWMLALGSLAQAALFIPIIGWFLLFPLLAAGALLMGFIEIVIVLTDPDGRRIGDKLAGTVVRAD